MALVRIQGVQRTGWKDVWARYYEQRPFPTPGPWMRKSMLSAEESLEVARGVHEAVEDAISPANRLDDKEEDSQDDSSENED
ncbi:hypothetical protein B0T25DRAFT_528449 [Lasiosphaeria hispida]|uniref:Uncharacterized protein n=1 Tax=Lasiosphaeria hispida TaxID=260671 RepID=A0AAJ0HW21_9PEZI|nr:hypothetical protein B0T25DRAFT_528449 [Lasiosphaeria hispida]